MNLRKTAQPVEEIDVFIRRCVEAEVATAQPHAATRSRLLQRAEQRWLKVWRMLFVEPETPYETTWGRTVASFNLVRTMDLFGLAVFKFA